VNGMARHVLLPFAEGHRECLHEQRVVVDNFYVADVTGDVGSYAPQRDGPERDNTGAEDCVSERKVV